ncbi:hypothetical protein CYMTET_42765 [Cymbomonas tetramitiformis]|uniref:Uncharacterized protein n=1 Tax=Cymbomonas tetramitiformis TaxID=36881 RepID=A0AAE0F1B4_9CHLO|nr:hypothetical protein CYMTET_42765 [Cymbomonas tetramitiformis]
MFVDSAAAHAKDGLGTHPLPSMKHTIADRRLLERFNGTTCGVSSTSSPYWFFCCTMIGDRTHTYNSLCCRLFGILYNPAHPTTAEMNGGNTCAARIVCGTIGTAHHLKTIEPEVNGPERRWDERNHGANNIKYPVFVDANVRADVYYNEARIACVWLPDTALWKSLATKAVHHPEATYERISRAMSIDMSSEMTFANTSSAPMAYVMKSETDEDVARAFPKRVRDKLKVVMDNLNRPSNRDDHLFPDMRYGTASTVCALELLELMDFALCTHCVERVLGARVIFIGKNEDRVCLPLDIGSSPMLKGDIWTTEVKIQINTNGYYDSQGTFLHEYLFHAVRKSLPHRQLTLGYECAADEDKRLQDYKELLSKSVSDTNWHVYAERRDEPSYPNSDVKSYKNCDAISESAWLYARCYLYPLQLLLDSTLQFTSGLNANDIQRTKGACGELPLQEDKASLRWTCVSCADGSISISVRILSYDLKLDDVRIYIDEEDVQSPFSNDLHLSDVRDTSYKHHFAYESTDDCTLDRTEYKRVWTLKHVRIGSMLRMITPSLRAQLILIPERKMSATM